MTAQTRETHIEGHIVNAENKTIPDVNVFVSKVGQRNRIFTSCLSDADGRYSLIVRTSEDSLSIHVTGFDIAPQEVICLNKSQSIDIVVEEKAQEIKEINVKAQKVYSTGDTINYNVVQFQTKTDVSIGQVLERMPGITVTESGKIQYKGLDIKNFYIEGLDLLKGRYGIATKNIDPNAIGTVQILENHQDVKALKDLKAEERASINLKLKSGVKGVFNLIGTLGGGYYENHFMNSKELIATYFRRNSQLFATYKDNNTGSDIVTELTSFDGNDMLHTSTVTDVTMPSAPGVGKQYYYFNKTHAATYNQVFRIRQNGELGINALYMSDRDTRSNMSTSNTLLPDGTRNIIDEVFSGRRYTDNFSGNITFMHNSDSLYVKEQLKVDWLSTDANSQLYTGQDIAQYNEMKNYRLHNFIHLTNRNDSDHGIDFISRINVEKRPHSLTVSPCLFPDILGEGGMNQDAETRNISTTNSLEMLSALVLGNLRINPTVLFDFANDELTSALQQYTNDIRLRTLCTGIGINAQWSMKRLSLDMYATGKYKFFQLKDNNTDDIESSHKLVVEPYGTLIYRVKSSDDIRLSGSLSYIEPTIEDLYDQNILTSYRQISYFEDRQLSQSKCQTYSLSYNHKNILSMLFCGIDLTYSHLNPEILYGSYYDGEVERITSRHTEESSNLYSTTIRFSKGFDWRRLKIGIKATYNYNESPLLIQDNIIRYDYKAMRGDMDISCNPFSFMAMSYNGALSVSKAIMEGGGSNPTFTTSSNILAFNFFLPYDMTIGAVGSHYYNDRNEKNKSFLLGEVNANYSYERWSFTLTCDNIFNRKDYVYSTTNDLTTSSSAYQLRPRSFMLKVRFRII